MICLDKLNYSKLFIDEILKEVKTVAIVGASARQERGSYKVMRSLLDNGYEVFPVNPNEEGNFILGQFCYKDLSSIQKKLIWLMYLELKRLS